MSRIVAVALLALAVGCGRSSRAPDAPANRVVVTASSVTAIPGRSAGPIALGMTPAAVRAALGVPDSDDGEFMQYYRHGLSIALAGGVVDAIHAYRGVPGGYEDEPWRAFALRLPNGLGWDATEAELRAAYGAPVAAGELAAAPIPSKWIDFGGVMFDFRVDDGRLFHLVVAAPPADE
ncbi:MAG: hypothetical protein IPH44_42955 [Myxococcales bacterium]|nr:hypothetical protein [Myxococcales bacterium]MBK7192842.1 hypothetical protein [Myxococcales bacterium]MBP6842962.1 hypothetical protein [Kofleriaceae bacterium]